MTRVVEALHGRGGGAVGKFDAHLHPHDRVGKFAKTFHVKLVKHAETKHIASGSTTRVDAVHVNGQHVGFLRTHDSPSPIAPGGVARVHHYVHGTTIDHEHTAQTVGGTHVSTTKSKSSHAELAKDVAGHIEDYHPELGASPKPKAAAAAAAKPEEKVPGATAIVRGKAGRWTKLNGKMVHIPHHDDYSRKVGEDTFTSPKGTTAVYKNGAMHNAPRATADKTTLVKPAPIGEKAVSLPPLPKQDLSKVSHAALKSQLPKLAPGHQANAVKAQIAKHEKATQTASDRNKAKAIIAKKYSKVVLDKPPPGGWTEADKVPHTFFLGQGVQGVQIGDKITGEAKLRTVTAKNSESVRATLRHADLPGTFEGLGGSHKEAISAAHSKIREKLKATGHPSATPAVPAPKIGDGSKASMKMAADHAALVSSKKPVTPQIPTSHPLTVALHGELAKKAGSYAAITASPQKGSQADLKPEHAGSGARSSAGRLRNFKSMSDDKLHAAHQHVVNYNAGKGSAGDHEGEQAVVAELQKRGISASTGSAWTFQEPKAAAPISAQIEKRGGMSAPGVAKAQAEVKAQGAAGFNAATVGTSHSLGGEVLKPELLSPGRSSAGRLRNFKAMSDAKLSTVIAQLTAHGNDPEAMEAVKKEAKSRTHFQEATFSEKKRGELADSGHAMPDGSFPIRNVRDLGNAVQAVGRSKNADAAKRHIVKRARALKATHKLPDHWNVKEADMDEESRRIAMDRRIERALIDHYAQEMAEAGFLERMHPRGRGGKWRWSGSAHEYHVPMLTGDGEQKGTEVVAHVYRADVGAIDLPAHLQPKGADRKAYHGYYKGKQLRDRFKSRSAAQRAVEQHHAGQVKLGLYEAHDKGAEPFSTSKTSNWVAKAGGLPHYIQHIAHDLMEKRGMDESRAIAMAVGIVKRWARGGGNVKPDTRAAAAKAVTEWEAKKAKAHATA